MLGLTRKKFTGAGEPVINPDTGEQYAELEYSDTLLIFLLKQSETKKKWRQRIIQVGNLALESVALIGKEMGLSNEQIEHIQTKMTERFMEVQLF